MPLLNIYTSATPEAAKRGALLRSLSSTLARELGKPESYMMLCLNPGLPMLFAASDAPTCYAELKNIGTFTPDSTRHLSALLCRTLSEALAVPENRIYIEFSNPPAHCWGFDNDTFA